MCRISAVHIEADMPYLFSVLHARVYMLSAGVDGDSDCADGVLSTEPLFRCSFFIFFCYFSSSFAALSLCVCVCVDRVRGFSNVWCELCVKGLHDMFLQPRECANAAEVLYECVCEQNMEDVFVVQHREMCRMNDRRYVHSVLYSYYCVCLSLWNKSAVSVCVRDEKEFIRMSAVSVCALFSSEEAPIRVCVSPPHKLLCADSCAAT